MAEYLNTLGKSSLAVAICDRCHFKTSITELISDPNAPGLRVHKKCADQLDPYRLPARKSDDITLQYPRLDEPLT